MSLKECFKKRRLDRMFSRVEGKVEVKIQDS